MLSTLWQDLRYGARTLLKHPGFTLVAVLTLSLGIGANSAIFSVVNGVLLRSLPYPNPERVVMLWEAGDSGKPTYVSHQNFSDWRAQQRSYEYISAYSARFGGPSTILGGSEPVRAYTVAVYRDFFNVLGVQPFLGRTFSPEESNFGTSPVAVVSFRFWQNSLNADPNLSGKKLTIGDRSFDVVGVMPAEFSLPEETDVWESKEQLYADNSSRSSHNYIGIARLKAGVSVEQAQSELAVIARRLGEQFVEDKQHSRATVVPLKEQLTGSVRAGLLVLLVAVGFVLLIACANVANLMLARAVGRQKEVAIRTALGANRLRIVRQLLTESLLLSLLGGTIGLLTAYWLISALIALAPATIPRLNEIGIEGRTITFTLGVALLTSVLFGLFPALRASNPDLNETLKEGGRGATGSSGLVRNGLVVTEIALTLVLLVGAGLLIKSLWRVLQINPGFNSDHVLTMQVSLPASEYQDHSRKINFYGQLFERTRSLPGVESVGIINNLPMGGVDINGMVAVAGRTRDQAGYGGFRVVSPDYFRTLNIPLVKGRTFNEQDSETSEAVAVISKSLADATFPNEDPIGQRVVSTNDYITDELLAHPERWPRIVGVVGDVRHFGLERKTSSDLYVCYTQRPIRIGDMSVVLRTKGDPSSLATTVRQEVRAIDKNLPLKFATLEEVFDRSTANRRYNVILLGAFAALALLLSMIGIYGVMSYAVSSGTREIGIRMALGARGADVLTLVVGQGMVLTLIGIVIGVAGAFALTRLMATLLFGVVATDLTIFTTVSLLIAAVALLACYLPARRAMKIDPMIALRYE
jgi:putative ABC transport system permease protein